MRDPNLAAGKRAGRWFDAGAFAAAPQFTIGNRSRNPVRGPGYRTVDVMVGKVFRVTERVGSEFRREAFHVTNTPRLGAPSGARCVAWNRILGELLESGFVVLSR